MEHSIEKIIERNCGADLLHSRSPFYLCFEHISSTSITWEGTASRPEHSDPICLRQLRSRDYNRLRSPGCQGWRYTIGSCLKPKNPKLLKGGYVGPHHYYYTTGR
jgi:hypothetical protein